jgi:hypothetical protein
MMLKVLSLIGSPLLPYLDMFKKYGGKCSFARFHYDGSENCILYALFHLHQLFFSSGCFSSILICLPSYPCYSSCLSVSPNIKSIVDMLDDFSLTVPVS